MTDIKKAEKIARAVLYEGYLLYPYRVDATKNRQRWTFGGLYPPAYVARFPGADSCELRSELLVEAEGSARLLVRLRFLHLVVRETWDEAREREKVFEISRLDRLCELPQTTEFVVAPEPGLDQRRLHAQVELTAERLGERPSVFKLSVRVRNRSEHDPCDRSEACLHSLLSTHLLYSIEGGSFVSMTDPPEPLKRLHGDCRNFGTWPVLVGQAGERDVVLSAPIILSDYPMIAPESPGDLFDGGEIDEVLSLRILTLTDQEKEQIRAADPIARAMLERTERLVPEELANLHGAWRDAEGRPDSVRVAGRELRAGSRVRLRPQSSSDAFDIVLRGLTATVESVEQDFEGGYHLTVSIDDDPGKDLGTKAQLGHRFFFRPEDVEPL